MSKSKKNVVDPDNLIAQYGADTARLFSLFAAPPEKDLEWNEQGVEGCFRFLNRVWRVVYDNRHLLGGSELHPETEGEARKLRFETHRTINKVTNDIDGRFHFNTAIAAIMELVNAVYAFSPKQDYPGALREALETTVRLLNPFVPHFAAELWQELGHERSLEECGWPVCDSAALVEDDRVIVVQVNGKVRSKITVPVSASEDEIKATAQADENVARYLENMTIRKVIVVPGRLVNIVVS